ncbi:MAG: hypothetical protein HY368_00580 [Candidatus Aenigmarchaeota archaeon]|nr:hypothetical protein [Candidatus Aenigmarchaeota archaeon]
MRNYRTAGAGLGIVSSLLMALGGPAIRVNTERPPLIAPADEKYLNLRQILPGTAYAHHIRERIVSCDNLHMRFPGNVAISLTYEGARSCDLQTRTVLHRPNVTVIITGPYSFRYVFSERTGVLATEAQDRLHDFLRQTGYAEASRPAAGAFVRNWNIDGLPYAVTLISPEQGIDVVFRVSRDFTEAKHLVDLSNRAHYRAIEGFFFSPNEPESVLGGMLEMAARHPAKK